MTPLSFRRAVILVAALSACIAAFMLWRYQWRPLASGDAWAYRFYAQRFAVHGLFHDFGPTRTYGYPLLLTPLAYLADHSHARLAFLSGAAQWAGLLGAAWFLASRLRSIGDGWALAAFAGILLGPQILALVTATLTEAPTVIAAVLLAGLALRLDETRTGRQAAGIMAAGALLAGFSMMIRPGNLALLLAWHASVLAAVLWLPAWAGRRSRMASLGLGAVLLSALPLIPQALYAFHMAGRLTPLPVCSLNNLQGAYGVALWKYDTVMTALGAAPWMTPNPLFSGTLEAAAWPAWYLGAPLSGLATLLAHALLSLDVSHVFVYIHAEDRWLDLPIRVAYWFAVGLGALTGGRLILRHSLPAMSSRLSLLCFVLGTLAAITALNAIAAVETRFGAIPVMLGLVLAFRALLGWRRDGLAPGLAGWIALVALTAGLTLGGLVVDRWGRPSLPEGTRIDFPPASSGAVGCGLTFESLRLGYPAVITAHQEELARRRHER